MPISAARASIQRVARRARRPARSSSSRPRSDFADLSPPTIADGPEGSLVSSSEAVEGERTVSLTARDEGGGLTSVGVLVDGVPAVERPADPTSSSCRTPYLVRVPCPLATSVTLRVQTSLTGRLQLPSGAPISDAVIRVQAMTALRGAKWRDIGSVTTGADGRFRYVARPGPSRTLRFTYFAFSLDPDPAATAEMEFGVTIYAVARRGSDRVPVAVLRNGPTRSRPVLLPLPADVRALHLSLPCQATDPGGLSLRRGLVPDRCRARWPLS